MKKVDAILMASGFSKRFGDANKLLYPFRGKALAKYTLELACSLEINKVMFITSDSKVESLSKGLDVINIHNQYPDKGIRESVRLGVTASEADFFLFFTCDQPLLDEDTVYALLERADDGKIVYPVYKGNPGNPSVFSSCFRNELLELSTGQQPRIIKEKHRDACIPIDIFNRYCFLDIDTLDDIIKMVTFL